MGSVKTVNKLISIIITIIIILLPIATGIFLVVVFKTNQEILSIDTEVPVFEETLYSQIWNQSVKKRQAESSSAAILDYSSLPYGRSDPFSQ